MPGGDSQIKHPFTHLEIAPDAYLDGINLRHTHDIFNLIDTNRDHLRPWFPWVDATESVDDTREFIKRMNTAWEEQTIVCTVILVGEKLAGLADLHAIDGSNNHASMGYWLGKQFEGQGIMTRAVRALLQYGFLELDLERIDICVEPGNRRSRAIPERLGFTLEGTLRHYQRYDADQYRDLMVYSLLSGEYAGKP
ncbi:MAG: GNAT family N-acetyltransferase [Candidatus Marinimicrobia bacterium]|nr:GNAT family N-acetyltransferase [Candidatus Neomarinimicrobiota bacterium]